MQKYRILGRKGEGTFSEVLKCQSIEDGQYYACKRMKQHFDSIDRVNNLREIQCMRRLSPHANIVDLKEVIFDKTMGTLALIMELLDMNLYEMIKGRKNFLTESKCQNYIYQTLKALDHMHRNGIFHRDVKPENILLKNDVVKLADFGSCRSLYSKQPYTEYISTRWYRAPECLLTDGWYTYKMDLWSIGCVFAEILSLRPIFPGANELDQITKIHNVLGTPSPEVLNKFRKSKHMDFNFPLKHGTGFGMNFSHLSRNVLGMVAMLCTYDPDERPSAKQVLRHQYFKSLRESEKRERKLTNQQQATNGHDFDEQNSVRRRNKDNMKKTHTNGITIRNLTTNNTTNNNNNNNNNNYPNVTGNTPYGVNDRLNHKTTLPKIPVATLNTSVDVNNTKRTQFAPTFFPSILQTDRDKYKKPQNDAAKRLGYSEYTLPSLKRLRHGRKL